MRVEELPDGRELVEHDDGRVEVRGRSTRLAERARAGYPPRRRRKEARVDPLEGEQQVDLDERGRCWVHTAQGPVELGGPPESLRHHPDDFPDEEWVLCVEGEPAWRELQLLLSVDPERFFAEATVIDRHRRPAD